MVLGGGTLITLRSSRKSKYEMQKMYFFKCVTCRIVLTAAHLLDPSRGYSRKTTKVHAGDFE